jgi:cell division protein FtsB
MPGILAGSPLLARRFLIALAVPAIVYALYATAQQAMESQRMLKQVADLQRHVSTLQADNARLQNELTFRRGDVYVEQVAREQLGLVMPGDVAVVLSGDRVPHPESVRTPAAGEAPTARSDQRDQTPLDAWFAYFFGD